MKIAKFELEFGDDVNKLAIAIALASAAHVGQNDKQGAPYILHPLQVMRNLNTDDEELMQIAVLHDIVEDTNVTLSQLSDMGFSVRVLRGIQLVTKHPTKLGQNILDFDYWDGIKGNVDAIRVKMADLEHNSLITRLKGVTDKDVARTAMYMRKYTELKDALNALTK